MLRRSLMSVAVVAALATGSASAETLYFDFNVNLNTPNASVFLFGNAGQTGTVSNLAGFNQSFTLGSNGFFSMAIPNSAQQSGTGVRNTGFRVDSDTAIAGYFINRAPATTDMTYLLGSSALDTRYVIASQGGGFGEGSQFAVHATQNNTIVTINLAGGGTVTTTLQAGETYKYAGGSTNLTGSFITADKAVAVFSGHECAQVPVGTTFCDTLLEQAIPISKLSTNYLLTASKGASLAVNRSDLVRVIATEDGTVVKKDGVIVATINKGAYYEFLLGAGGGSKIETSAAAAVAQYLTGGAGANTDPAYSYVPGSDTWLKDYRLATPSGNSAFIENYAALVINTADLGTLLLDGVAVDTSGFTAIGATGFSRGIVNLPLGLFTLSAASAFEVMLGGGSAADSYFTYGGSTFAPGVSPPPPPNDVPEPGALGLLAAAAAGLAFTRRRRTR